MHLSSRPALKRVIALTLAIVALTAIFWFTMIRMPGNSYRGPLPPLTPEQTRLRDELQRHVWRLAGEIGERHVFQPRQLHAAADYIEAELSQAGRPVVRQSFEVRGVLCHNLEIEIPGSARPDEILVVGAHYDSVSGSPGADDNASGVAALLTLARRLAAQPPARTLRLVAFANEEPPFFMTGEMGSLVYARRCRERGDRIALMLSLESLGYYASRPGSQRYPFPLGLFYPSRGDFIGFVGRTADAQWVRRCVKLFREHARFPSEGGALPGWLPGVGWSDHWAFWQVGYPAVMITDTAIFRSPHYHAASDTPDQLDYDRFARVVDGLGHVISSLAATNGAGAAGQ
ncbi:MAG: M28 family peptidase [Verrucomicrobiae bacterium]|nr:M28 family peptidase [Verrucomicrobiae bacterium]MDW8309369.1 M28 family peptidase [Verrucomicrobiales bacterium]